jgi:Beta-propeller repeat
MYDPSRPLIVDPVLSYATYLGGGADDAGRGIAVDATGAAYIVGETMSSDFPASPDAVQPELRGASDVVVAKLTPDGTALVYATYLGGGADDLGRGIAVDATGAVYVMGQTASADFPTAPGAIQPLFGGEEDAFVAKLAPDGATLVYATYLGGRSFDDGRAIVVDGTGAAYVTGGASAGFPTTPGAVQPAPRREGDAFVAKLTPDGTALVYATYVGGSSFDIGSGMAIDATGAAYITGETYSPDFPTTSGVLQATHGGDSDVFVAKLTPDGTALAYATYVGGSSFDIGQGIAVDGTGAAYVTGTTGFFGGMNNFPTTLGAVQPTFGGLQDAFVAKLTPNGTALVYSTYLGGSQFDGGQSIAVDATGAAYVMGATSSSEFPTTPAAIQPTLSGDADSFITTLTPSGVGLAFSTYLGGSGSDLGMGISGQLIAVDAARAVYVTWGTDSSHFPTTPGVVQPRLGGGTDAFLAKIVLQLPPEDVITIRQALFVDRLALLVVMATSSAAPDAELFVTVPECFLRVPMSQVNDRYLLVRTVPECEDLDGRTALVTSNHGGSASAPLR